MLGVNIIFSTSFCERQICPYTGERVKLGVSVLLDGVLAKQSVDDVLKSSHH